MSRQEVMQAMGTGSATVREAVYVEQRLAGYIDLAVTNPYRLETDVIGGNRFEILYYYARPNGMGLGYWDTQFADRAVPDWFLTPVVLENGRLVGWGPEVLEREGLARPPASPDEDRWLYVGRCCLEHAPRH